MSAFDAPRRTQYPPPLAFSTPVKHLSSIWHLTCMISGGAAPTGRFWLIETTDQRRGGRKRVVVGGATEYGYLLHRHRRWFLQGSIAQGVVRNCG
jgi:hypothetical protein